MADLGAGAAHPPAGFGSFIDWEVELDTEPDISGHYSRGNLLERLRAILLSEGVDPNRPSLEALAPFDHFHGRGLEATEELANSLPVQAADHILDVGSGIGGPARYFANRFGCRVTGIDLTAEFCDVARVLTRTLGCEDRVAFEQGNALAMPFAEASFDGAYSMNVSMNIADKMAFYREIYRVLRPGGWLMLSELARGPAGGPDYPTPWARSAAASFLATPSETLRGLEAASFTVVRSRETANEAKAFSTRSRALVERGAKPPHRAVQLIHGDLAAEMAANTSRAIAEENLIPIEILCRKEAKAARHQE
jgi:ubiquinone/menaquinone biosynthesis C-methylase UbiE